MFSMLSGYKADETSAYNEALLPFLGALNFGNEPFAY